MQTKAARFQNETHTHTRTRDATTLLKHREQTQILTTSSVVKKLTEIRDNQGI